MDDAIYNIDTYGNLILFYILVTGLVCWLCAGGSGSSFLDCNTKKTVQDCTEDKFQEEGKGPLNRCAYFSFFSFKKGKRIFAKSCTFASYCKSNEEFCKNIPGGATQCQVTFTCFIPVSYDWAFKL
jgi:hypothetical protein